MILSYNHRFGVNCKQDFKKAEDYCLLACSEGSKLALGMKHLFGWKTEKDEKKAFEIFNQIVENEKDDTSFEELRCSVFLLGRCYDNGFGTERDIHKSLEYYEKGSEMGEGCSMYNLACIRQDGDDGTEKNVKLSKDLYKKVIKLNVNISSALNNLANIYKNGDESQNVKKNIPKAIKLYERAIENGDRDAMFNIARFYEKGDKKEGFEKNFSLSIHYYEIAAKLGHSSAMNNLGIIYECGKEKYGIKKNVRKAFELYEYGCSLNNIYAMYNLAFLYKEGDQGAKIERDINKACSLYFQRFSVDDHQSSMKHLMEIFKNSQNEIVWRQEYHTFWNKESNLNPKIIFLLLISKHRNEMKNKPLIKGVFVKGITLKISKYLCHFSTVNISN